MTVPVGARKTRLTSELPDAELELDALSRPKNPRAHRRRVQLSAAYVG